VLLAMDHEQVLLSGRMGLVDYGLVPKNAQSFEELAGLPIPQRLPGVVLPEIVFGEFLIVKESAMVPSHKGHLKVGLV
jgi:hypothetical protein